VQEGGRQKKKKKGVDYQHAFHQTNPHQPAWTVAARRKFKTPARPRENGDEGKALGKNEIGKKKNCSNQARKKKKKRAFGPCKTQLAHISVKKDNHGIKKGTSATGPTARGGSRGRSTQEKKDEKVF